MKEVYIVGGGPSLKDFDFNKLKDKETITVNKSLFFVPNPNYFVTMDFTFLRKISTYCEQFKNSLAAKFFVVNFSMPYIQEKDGIISDTRTNLIYDLKDFNVVIKSQKPDLLGTTWTDFRHGGNSGFCALQLAILLNYEKIHLLGIDLSFAKDTHFHEGYNSNRRNLVTNLDNYFHQFVYAIKHIQKLAPQIQIINHSKYSRIRQLVPYESQESI